MAGSFEVHCDPYHFTVEHQHPEWTRSATPFTSTMRSGPSLTPGVRVATASSMASASSRVRASSRAAASAGAQRRRDVVIPEDGVSALDPFDLAAGLRQVTALFAGRVTTAGGIELSS
jgi:hypothetical protein